MDSNTVRTALGQLQENPDSKEGWDALKQSVEQLKSGAADLAPDELIRLIHSAQKRHAERGEWVAATRLLELGAENASGDAQLGLLRELSGLYQEQLYDEEGHELTQLRVLELFPDDQVAKEALAEAQAKRGRFADMFQSYSEEAENAPDEIYKSSMLMRASELEVRFAGQELDLARTTARLEEAFRLDGNNVRAAALLELLYRRAGDHGALAEVLKQLVIRPADISVRISAGVRLARLALQNGEKSAAAEAYEQVLALSPSQGEAKRFLSEYYSEQENWDALVGVYEGELKGAQENSERVGDMLQIAMLHWKKREQLADAEPWFERVRRIEAANPLMLMFFREYTVSVGDDARLLAVLQGAQRVMPEGPEKAELTQQVAKLAESQQDAQKAIEQYKGVLRQDPDNQDARDALKRLYRQTEGYNALVELLRQELERTDKDNAEARVQILREVAALYRQHIKSDTALVTVLNQILQLDPSDADSLRELVRLYEQLGRHRDLLANQQRLAEILEDPAEKEALLRDVARRWLDQFSNVQNATDAYQKLWEVVPGDREAAERLEELYKKRRAWGNLYDLYVGQLSHGSAELSAERQLELRKEMAKLAAERLQKPDEAIALYQEVLDADPEDRETLDQLEKQAERSKNWAVLAKALERRVALETGEKEQLSVLQKLGSVYGDQLADFEGAVSVWRRVLVLQPGNNRALRTLRDAFLERQDFEELERLYAEQGDLEGFADVLSGAADKAKEVDAKVDLSYRAAKVYEEQLGQSERAVRSYERILAAMPEDIRAARALIPIYEQEEKWARLPALYVSALSQETEEADRLGWLNKLVEVSANRLSDRQQAVQYARQAYELAPTAESTLEGLEAASRAAGAWPILVEAIEGRLTSGAELSAEETRGLKLKLAQVYAEELGRSDEAAESYKSLLADNPGDTDAALALEAILRREGKREDLRWLLGLRVENAESDAAKVRILSDWATLEEDVFEEPARAIELHQQVLALEPADTAALNALPRLLIAAENYSAAAEVMEAHRDQLSGEARAIREVELSELYLKHLGQPQASLEAAVRALELNPGDAQAVELLEELLKHPEQQAQAASVLAEAYAEGGEAKREVEALQVMLAAATEPDERLSLFSRLADVHEEKLGAYGAALDVILAAANSFPTELDLWDRADALATLAGRPADLAKAYEEAVTGELAAEVSIELCERAATLYEDKLGDPIGATPYLERVLAQDPSREQAFARLKDILTASERWSDLEALYERASAATDDTERRAELLVEVALICEEIIEDPAKATKHYERVLELDPAHDTAARSLDRLYAQQERYDDLAKLLTRRLESVAGDEQLGLRKRLATLLLERLGQPEAAIDSVEFVLSEEVGDYEARELAEKLLEVPSLKNRAARILEYVYESRSETRDLVRVLGAQVETLPEDAEPEAKKDLLRRIAVLRDDELRDDPGALAALSELVPLDPLDSDARERLLNVGRREGAHAQVAGVLKKTAESVEDNQLKAEILLQVARIQEDLLGEVEQATETYQAVLSLEPREAGFALPAARALERIYTTSAQHERLVELLKIQVELEEDPEVRRELLGRLGELSQEILGDSSGAIAAWQSRLEEDPADHAALVALDDLYQRTEQWQLLSDILERRADSSEDSEGRQRLLERRAELLQVRLSQPSEAIIAWTQVVDEFGPSSESLSALEQLYQTTERWDELTDTFQAHLDLSTETDERLDLLARLGELKSSRLSDPEGALEAYREALTVDSKHEPSRAALTGLLEHEENLVRREAAAILRPIFEDENSPEQLLKVIEIEIATQDDPLNQLDGYEAALGVAEGSLEDPKRAFAYVERAVRTAVGHADLKPWLDRLDRLAAATQNQPAHVQLLCEVVPEIFDGEVQLGVILKVADLARHQLGDRELAREYYIKALDLQSDDTTALIALESLYEEAGDGQRLLEILERRVEAAEDDTERKQLLFRRANLLAEVLEEPARAAEVYQTILDIDLDPKAVEALTAIHRGAGQWDELVELYQRQLDALDSPGGEERAKLHVAIAGVAAAEQADLERAFDEIESALEADENFQPAIDMLEAWQADSSDAEHRARAAGLLEPVYLRRGDFAKLRQTIAARLDFEQDTAERRELLTRLARLYEEQEEDYAQALETTAKLLREDKEDEETAAELERLAKVAGAEQRLAEIYASEVDEVVSDEVGLRFARRAGELFAQLNQAEKALVYYRRALAYEPESRELFDAIDALLVQTESYEERVQLYRDALDHRYEPGERLEALHVVAELQRTRLNQPEEAIASYVQALDVEPNDERSLTALTELYRGAERFTDLAELYTRRAENNAGAEGAEYRLELARLLKGQLGEVERSIEQLQEIVLSVPSSEHTSVQKQAVQELESLLDHAEHKERVVEILRPLYEESDDWQRQIKLNEERLELAQDELERVEILRESARLWEARGSDLDRARAALAAALTIAPGDDDVREEYQRLVEDTAAWDELAVSYEALSRRAEPELETAALEVLAYLGRVHDKHRDDPRAALEVYQRLYELNQHEPETAEQVERLAALLGDWSALVQVLSTKADGLFGDAERALVWREVGGIRRDMLELPIGAIEAFEKALELEPEHNPTLDALIELHGQAGQPERLVELYQRRVESSAADEGDLRYELLLATAKIQEEKLEDRDGAMAALEKALAARPGDRAVLSRLGELYRLEERWAELLDNLKLEASTEDSQERRVELREQIGEILADKLQSYDEALEVYRLVLDESAERAQTRLAVKKLGDEHEDLRAAVAEILVPVLRSTAAYQELVEVLELRLSAETDPTDRAETLRTLAAVYESNLNQPGLATKALMRAVVEAPESVDLHHDIEGLIPQTEAPQLAFADYAQTLEERASATFDPDLVKELFSRLGVIAEERLEDPKRAISAYSRAVEQVGDQPELLRALDRLYGKVEDFSALADILERRGMSEESEAEQAELFYRQAEIQIDHFKDSTRGLAALKQALERAPAHEASTKKLEELTSEAELFEEVSELLEEIYRSTSRTGDLASLYEKRLSAAESSEQRLEMRRDLARVLEEDVADPKAAQRVLQQGLKDHPADAELLAEIERLAPVTGDWESAAAALRDAIKQGPEEASGLSPDLAKELSLKLAGWYRDKVDDTAAAEAALVHALELDPESDELLLQLEQLQKAEGRKADLVLTLRRRAKLQQDFATREILFQQAKEYADQLEDRALAESVLREFIALDDANIWALAQLTELREAAEDHEETYGLLVKRAELSGDDAPAGASVRELRLRAALIARDKLKDSERAIGLFEQLFEEEPTDAEAAKALRELLAETDRFAELGRLLERLIDVSESVSERGDLRVELAKLNQAQFNAPDTAIDLLRVVIDDEPERSEAVVLLSELYEQLGRDEELAELLKEQIDAAKQRGDSDAELTFEVRLGELFETRLNDPARATETYRAVLARSGEHTGALEALARLYRAQEKAPEAAEMLSRLLNQSEGEQAIARSLELAEAYEALGELEPAAEALERGLSHDGAHQELRARLVELYTKLSSWEKLAKHIAEDAERAEGADAQAALLVKAASIHEKKRKDYAASAELLERASQLKPEDRELMLALCDAYSGSGRGKAAVEVLERIVESYQGKRSKELGDIHRRLATAYLADGDQPRALEELDKAFRIEPGNIQVLSQLGSVSLEAGDHKKAQQMFRALLLQKLDEDSPITKAEVFYNLGRVHHALGEKPKAVQMLERAVQADSELQAAKDLLGEVKGS